MNANPQRKHFVQRHWKVLAVIALAILLLINQAQQDSRDALNKHEDTMRYLDRMSRETDSERRVRLQAEEYAGALRR